MTTPNQFEAEMLTGIEIKDEKSGFAAIEKLHAVGPKVVVLSSAFFKHGFITVLASQVKDGNFPIRVKIECPLIGEPG